MTEELPKNYSPEEHDPKWNQFWEEHSLFRADASSDKPPFCIVIPPPNVTGALHMGHALVNTLQDILIRFKRMQGYEALWVPGTDHAGISTQTVVERHLIESENKRRSDYSREEFLAKVWEWKSEYEKRIVHQLKKMGCSCDWSRMRFTMDEKSNRAVRTVFEKLYDQGLIHKADYLVNWDPVTQTAIADDEVEYEERLGHLWTISYPVVGEERSVQIATTRPETMLGDTAVAVHPKDERYADLIGKKLLLPLVNREIPIIADRHVDPEFGTGCVKVTPAHDPNDYEMGVNHDLPFINIMTPDGKINEEGGEFQGLSMLDAREAVVEKLKQQGFLVKVEEHPHRVGLSYRSKAVIEPYMSKQWFVKMGGFQESLEKMVSDQQVALLPKSWENTYFHWIRNLRDWCISRQLWWGHQIPVWYEKAHPENRICYAGEGLPKEVEENPDAWEQDPDVLDTWFSSALWPFSTLGWPEKTEELEKFYPNSVLVTGHDILFFWVARMLLMGNYIHQTPPFPKVFLHGLIFGKSYWRKTEEGSIQYVSREERRKYELGTPPPKEVLSRWEKMSKSKGNILDPLEIIEEYGTDAMRIALASTGSQSREIDLDLRKFEEFRNFTNKVWNGARFVLMNLQDGEHPGLTSTEFTKGLDLDLLDLEDHWILAKLSSAIETVTKSLDSFSFDTAALCAYDFFWKEFCAYYVEIVKPTLFGKEKGPEERTNKQKVLAIVLLASIRLLHPMTPFITEELFQTLKTRLGVSKLDDEQDPYTRDAIQALHQVSIAVAPYPTPLYPKEKIQEVEKEFALLEEVIYSIRNIRGEMKLPPSSAVEVHLVGKERAAIEKNASLIRALVKTKSLEFHDKEPPLDFASSAVVGSLKLFIPLPSERIEEEKRRLSKEQTKLEGQLQGLRSRLDNPEFVSRAPEELIAKTKEQLQQQEHKLEEIQGKLALLQK